MQPEQNDLGLVLNDETVLRFLTTNPDFFIHNQDLISRLRIPHDSGQAVSLIEKQVSVLRNKCSTLENSLRDLIAVARENENLHHRLHLLIQDVISAPGLERIVALTRSSLCENFNADEVHLLLITQPPKQANTRKKTATDQKSVKTTRRRKPKVVEGLQVVIDNDECLNLFTDLFETGETVCGLPGNAQLECFVGKNYSNIASAAMIPLFHERQLGVVMLTSKDESRFSSGKGVMFLNQLGALLSRRLHSYGAISSSYIK
jgi:uncharacterized protein